MRLFNLCKFIYLCIWRSSYEDSYVKVLIKNVLVLDKSSINSGSFIQTLKAICQYRLSGYSSTLGRELLPWQSGLLGFLRHYSHFIQHQDYPLPINFPNKRLSNSQYLFIQQIESNLKIVMNCTYECIMMFNQNKTSQCQFIDKVCISDDLINFTRLYFCSLNQSTVAQLLFTVLLAVFSYYTLSLLSDQYLQPALRHICQKIRISRSLAGLTFMAFGNGAPDVLTAIIGTSNDDSDQGAVFPIGSLYGACLFSTCLILFLVIRHSPKPIQAEPSFVYRDIGFFLLSSVTLLVYGVFGYVNIAMASIFFVYYGIYVLIVIKQEKIARRRDAEEYLESSDSNYQAVQDEEKQGAVEDFNRACTLFFNMTVPVSDPNNYSKLKNVIGSFIFPFLIYAVCTSFCYNLPALISISVISLLLITLSSLLTKRMYNRLSVFYSLGCFVGTLLWMMLLVDIVLSYLTFLGLMTDTSQLFLGLTILAVANCLGDWFSYVGSAKAGMGLVSVAGVFGGQLFNLMVGFGTSLFYQSIVNNGRVNFQLFKAGNTIAQTLENSMGFVVIGSVILHLLICLYILRKDGFVLGNSLIVYLRKYYALVLGVMCALTIFIDILVDKTCKVVAM